MTEHIDCVVIGAGVVGLAAARALAIAGRQVLVVERNERIGEETSSRNSEVIHAGLYYPTNSLKATLCTAGKQMLYTYCEQRQIPHKRCGKLIVAIDDDQRERLAQIAQQARRNGVDDLVELDRSAVQHREPAVTAVAGLWSPSTGIIDSHALMLALQGDLEAADGLIATQTSVASIAVADDGVHLTLTSDGDDSELLATTVINAAGLGALALAAACTGTESYAVPQGWIARGHYFNYAGPVPFHSLVYPIPVAGGLGIHATLDLGGSLRFGPDVEWIDTIDYSVDPGRAGDFAAAIRTYWPEVDETLLVPGYSGIRPKLSGPGQPAVDFRIDTAAHGACAQLIHLLGIESPGLTASLAIADTVLQRVGEAS